MTKRNGGARPGAIAAAALLLLTGALLGVLVDRLWLVPRQLEAMPLTADAMTERLGLGTQDEARIRALLDSLHAEVMATVARSPDSLRAVTRNAHLRIQAALPPEARPGFGAWMQDHHRQMMERMGGGPGGHGPDGPGEHAPGGGMMRHMMGGEAVSP